MPPRKSSAKTPAERYQAAVLRRLGIKKLKDLPSLPPVDLDFWPVDSDHALLRHGGHLALIAFVSPIITKAVAGLPSDILLAHQLVFDLVMAPAVLGAIALKARHSCSGVCLFTTSTDNEMADGFLLYIGAVIRSSDMGRRSLRPWIELVFETLAEGAANALKPTQPRQRAKRTSDEAEKENSRKRVKGTGRPKSVLPEATASPLSDSTNASTPAPVSEAPRKVAKASVPVASKV